MRKYILFILLLVGCTSLERMSLYSHSNPHVMEQSDSLEFHGKIIYRIFSCRIPNCPYVDTFPNQEIIRKYK